MRGARAGHVGLGRISMSPSACSELSNRLRYPRVQAKTGAQLGDRAAVLADLPQHPRFAERAVMAHVAVRQRADPLGDRTVEVTDLGDGRIGHLSDFSQIL